MGIITIPIEKQYIDELIDISFENYSLERKQAIALSDRIDKDYFYDRLNGLFADGVGRIALENGKIIGYLAFHTDSSSAYSPLYGYGIRYIHRGEVISKLFQDTATVLCENFYQNFRINVYANDSDVLWTYIMSAFTMDVTDVVRDTTSPIEARPSNAIFKEIDKRDLLVYQKEIVGFYRNLITHLRVSPVFYPCDEFLPIEDRFEDFLSDNMRVFAAFDGSKLVGMVGSEPSDSGFALGDSLAMNLTDLFVAPDYRRMGVAAALLAFTNDEMKKSGIQRLFVTHGTVNPTARGFWDKYFTNYSYTLTRKINEKMLGVIKSV